MRSARTVGRLALLVAALVALGRPSIALAVDVVAQFEGLANADNAVMSIPPDDILGAGPNHVFEMVNNVGRITDKAGVSIQSFELQNFFGVDANFTSTDPQVMYDAISGRWFASYGESKSTILGGSSSIILAVSATSDPTGQFCLYRLGNPTSETFFQDQPLLAVSDDKVVVSYNAFTFSLSLPLGAGYYVINKSQLLACSASPSVTRVAPDASLFGLRPAQSLSSTSALYMVENNDSSLTLLTIQGVPGASAVTSTQTPLPIRTWTAPPPAPQPGSKVFLDTGDERVLSASWRMNSLWLAGNEACTPPGDTAVRSCLRFIEVSTDSLAVRQDLTFGASGEYYYYPALAPDSYGDILVVFTASSSSEFASVRITGRLSTDPLNTLQPSQLLRAGSGAQQDPSGRMGDYSGAAVDPVAPSNVWVSGEYIRSTAPGDWGSYIASLRFDVPALAAAVLPSSRSVEIGSPATAFATILAAGTGTAIGCSIAPLSGVPATFAYQTTDSATNQVTGTPNTPVNIAAGGTQTFVISFTPTAPFGPIDVQLTFDCVNTIPAPLVPGVNTLLLSASSSPVPDVVALAATQTNDGIVDIPGVGETGAFAVATVNVGSGGMITATADTGLGSPPVSIALCQTNPQTGVCLKPPASNVITQIDANATPTFAIFATATGAIPFDPASSRIFVYFRDANQVIRGATSVAVRTP